MLRKRLGEIIYENSEIWDPEIGLYHATRGSIAFSTNSITLTLPASKTDPFRRGVAIPIAATGDEACPLASLNNLFTRFPEALTEPLFGIGRKCSKRLVNLEIGEKLCEANIFRPPSCHGFSLRAGAATWAKQMGLSDREIMLLGRWKSDVFSTYIHNNVNMVLDASRRFQRQRRRSPRRETH